MSESRLPLLLVENLSKEFSTIKKDPGLWGTLKALVRPKREIKKAVDDISFSIAEGEMVGYIGANGAGKSTTIKMMTGILTPTSGRVTVNGLVPYEQRQKHARSIGVVFGQRTQLWWDLPLRETFSILRQIYEVPKARFDERMAYLNKLLELDEFIGQPVRTLSLGQRMRADLAASLLHDPKVLFLDEPTIGLDIVVKERVLEAIKDSNRQFGTTVILTTHDLEDIQELCRRIIIIDKGRKVYDGGLKDIKETYGVQRSLVMEVKDPEAARSLNLNGALGLNAEQLSSAVEGNTLTVKFHRQATGPAEILGEVLKRVGVADMKVQETEIEEIVKEIYAGRVL